MAYSGYLIKLGGQSGETLPMKYIALESYSCTPNQRMESKATRSVDGMLHRTTVSHTASKIEFQTPMLTNNDITTLNGMFQARFSDALQRKLKIYYYDMESDSYKVADVYMPDVQYTIHRVDNVNNVVYYNPVRFAFIEY